MIIPIAKAKIRTSPCLIGVTHCHFLEKPQTASRNQGRKYKASSVHLPGGSQSSPNPLRNPASITFHQSTLCLIFLNIQSPYLNDAIYVDKNKHDRNVPIKVCLICCQITFLSPFFKSLNLKIRTGIRWIGR